MDTKTSLTRNEAIDAASEWLKKNYGGNPKGQDKEQADKFYEKAGFLYEFIFDTFKK